MHPIALCFFNLRLLFYDIWLDCVEKWIFIVEFRSIVLSMCCELPHSKSLTVSISDRSIVFLINAIRCLVFTHSHCFLISIPLIHFKIVYSVFSHFYFAILFDTVNNNNGFFIWFILFYFYYLQMATRFKSQTEPHPNHHHSIHYNKNSSRKLCFSFYFCESHTEHSSIDFLKKKFINKPVFCSFVRSLFALIIFIYILSLVLYEFTI